MKGRLPHEVDVEVVHQRKKPGAQIGAVLPEVLLGKGAHEGILDQIISPAGVQPQDSHLDHPVTVTFVNRDSVAHTPESAPEIGNGDCPEMSQVGRLEPGQSGMVAIDKANYICSYHDALQPAVLKFKGILVVH